MYIIVVFVVVGQTFFPVSVGLASVFARILLAEVLFSTKYTAGSFVSGQFCLRWKFKGDAMQECTREAMLHEKQDKFSRKMGKRRKSYK